MTICDFRTVQQKFQREKVTQKNAPRRPSQALISDPGQSLRKLASIVDVSDLRYKSYTLKIQQMFSEAAKSSCSL